MRGLNSTYEDVAVFLEQHGERYLALLVRQQTEQFRACRANSELLLRKYYELRDKIDPPTHYVAPNYRSPPESDG